MFEIPEFLSVGRLILPVHLLLMLAIGLAMLFLVKWICTRVTFPYNEWKDIWSNGLISYLIIWKFSFILFDPVSVIQQPAQLLFANGGALGHGLALLGAIGFMLFSLKKRSLSVNAYFDIFSIWIISILTIYWVIDRTYGLPTTLPWGISLEGENNIESSISYHPVFLYHFLLGSFLLLMIFQLKDKLGSGLITFQSLFILGLGLLFVSTLIYQPATLLLGFSGKQWLYLGLSVLGLLGLFQKR